MKLVRKFVLAIWISVYSLYLRAMRPRWENKPRNINQPVSSFTSDSRKPTVRLNREIKAAGSAGV